MENTSLVLNANSRKSVQVKTSVGRKLQKYPSIPVKSNFKCIVISDTSDEDEIVSEECPQKENIDVHKQLKNTLSSCIGHQIMNHETPSQNDMINSLSMNGEKTSDGFTTQFDSGNGEICQNGRYSDKETKDIHLDDKSLKNLTLEDKSLTNVTLEDSVLENLIGHKFDVGEVMNVDKCITDVTDTCQSSNDAVNVHSSGKDVEDGKKHVLNGNLTNSLLFSNKLSSGKNDLVNSVIKDTSHTECKTVESHGNLDNNHENKENRELVPEQQLVSTHNIGMKNGLDKYCSHNEVIENDVITEVFKAGQRQRAWELMKTKRRSPQHKKVIYPVVVKNVSSNNKHVVTACTQDNKSSDITNASVVSPLQQFQNSLENQIKDLVTTIQTLHTVEKDAIMNTLASQQQTINKETLDALLSILNEKSGNKKEDSVEHKACNKCETTSNASHVVVDKPVTSKPSVNTKSVKNQSCQKLNELPSNVAKKKSVFTNSPHQSVIDNNVIVKSSSDVIKAMAGVKLLNKKINGPKKKAAPHFSILKTPVRRKKAPVPFSEKSREGEIPVSFRASAPSCALLKEILKDTSCTKDTSLESKQGAPEVVNYPEQGVTFKDDLCSQIEKNRADTCTSSFNSKENQPMDVLEMVTSEKHMDQESVDQGDAALKNHTVGNILFSSVNNNLDSKEDKSENNIVNYTVNKKSECFNKDPIAIGNGNNEDNILQFTHANSVQNKLYNFPEKLTLDERINKLRQNFINSENKWLYESKENSCSSDTTVENAQKVLREVQLTGRMLENDDFMKYKDRNDMFSYFEANPYLVDAEVVRIKKDVDENIKKMNTFVQKKVNKKKNVKHERKPLKEKNTLM